MKDPGINEKFWVEAFTQGDEKAIAHFFDLHYKSLCYFSNRLVNDQLQAEDIVSDCFLNSGNADRIFNQDKTLKLFYTSVAECLHELPSAPKN